MPSNVINPFLGVATANGLAPKRGPRSIIQSVDFSVAGTSPKTINFADAQNAGKIEFIQTIKVDNTSNSAPVILTDNNTQDVTEVPAYAMAYLPVLASRTVPNFSVSTSGSALVNFYFLSQAMPAVVWYPKGINGSGSSGFVGTNYSVNQGSVGANLIVTIPAGARNGLHIQNQAASQIQVLLSNSSILLLESGGGDNVGGGACDVTDQGIVKIYSSEANAPVAIYAF